MCEGEKDKSEYVFISAVISEFKIDESYNLVAAGGKENIDKEFLKLKKEFCQGDIFILFFDNIEMIGGKLTVDLLSSIEVQCKNLGVFFRYTTYYCFEELFLSYTNLLPMLNVDIAIKNEISNIQHKLLSGVNYFRDDISFWINYFGKHRKGVLKTREKLSFGICNLILNTINGSFYLQKDKIGSCWVTDCKDSTLHKNVCVNCKYKLKNCSFRCKLEDLDNNSVSILSLPFSTIFNKY